MDLVVIATAFILIAPVELPDKTFIATLVLSTRYPALPVWLGVLAAFAAQCLLAVTAGTVLTLLPKEPVQGVAALLFGVGALVLFVSARGADAQEKEQEQEYAGKLGRDRRGWRAAVTSFVVLFTAEWGDLSQLLTAGLVAREGAPVSVFLGSFLALAAVSGAAVLLGRALLKRIRLSVIRYLGATVCAVLCGITVIDLISSL